MKKKIFKTKIFKFFFDLPIIPIAPIVVPIVKLAKELKDFFFF